MSGWNRSTGTAKPEPQKKFGVMRGAIVGVAVVAVFGIVTFLVFGRQGAKPKIEVVTEGKPAQIAVVKPAPAPKTQDAPLKVMSKDEKRLAQLKQIRDKYGDNIPENLKPTVYFLENPPKQSFHPARSRANIFKNKSDRRIASVLLIKPGDWMVRPPKFDQRFDSDFAAALNDPIVISPDDSAEDKELKEAVKGVRAELAERQKAGETPSSIMQNEIDSLSQLGNYKHDLEKQLLSFKRDESYTDNDIRDFVTAANEMLQKKGLPGFKMPNMMTRRISLQRASARKSKALEEKSR